MSYYNTLSKEQQDALLAVYKPVAQIPTERAKWLVEGYIPQGCVTVLAADGGIGKSTISYNIATALSKGEPCFLDSPNCKHTPAKILFLSSEEEARTRQKPRLAALGADLNNIITADAKEDVTGVVRNVKIDSAEFAFIIHSYKPDLCVIDPIQSFIDRNTNMSARNQIRSYMDALTQLANETGTTFLLVCHTNKKKGVWARARLADSADLWDGARCVLMAGRVEGTEQRYLSNEKNNFADLTDTVLFSIANGAITVDGITDKRDRDFVADTDAKGKAERPAPKRSGCIDYIVRRVLAVGGSMPMRDLDKLCTDAGFSTRTLADAKSLLYAQRRAHAAPRGYAKAGSRTYRFVLDPQDEQEELPFPDQSPAEGEKTGNLSESPMT